MCMCIGLGSFKFQGPASDLQRRVRSSLTRLSLRPEVAFLDLWFAPREQQGNVEKKLNPNGSQKATKREPMGAKRS